MRADALSNSSPKEAFEFAVIYIQGIDWLEADLTIVVPFFPIFLPCEYAY